MRKQTTIVMDGLEWVNITYHGSKLYEHRSDCSYGSSLIWVHIVCNIGYQSKSEEKADDNCYEWPGKGAIILIMEANSMTPDQTAPLGAV